MSRTPRAEGPASRHAALVREGKLQPDPDQTRIADELDGCFQDLMARQGGWFRKPTRVPGVYIHGAVGRGKTLLMDLFVDSLESAGEPVERAHFHRFMDATHTGLNALRGKASPLSTLARELRKRTRVVCFDEFHVEDIADAMLLGELTAQWFELGMTLVATSNSAPDELYAGGLQRERFVPAIESIQRHCRIVELDAAEDYRLRELTRHPTWTTPAGPDADATLTAEFNALSPNRPVEQNVEIEIRGRSLNARARSGSVLWAEFSELCDGPRSASDYIELSRRFSTLLVSNVPQLDEQSNNAARRFIHLVDECYDRNVKLIASAAAPIPSLYSGKKLAAPFERTTSRLIEMQSSDYLARPHRP